MVCPKCKSHTGIHYHERYLQSHSNAQGINCFICGFWSNGELMEFEELLMQD